MKLTNKGMSNKDIQAKGLSKIMSILEGYSQYEEYEQYNENLIIGIKNSKENVDYTNREVFKEIQNLGKKFYKIVKEELQKHTEKRLNEEILFEYLGKPKNEYLSDFFPKRILDESPKKEKVYKIILEYCKINGFPIVDKEFTESRVFEDKTIENVGYMRIHPFVQLSTLFFVLYKIQYALNKIIDNIETKKELDKNLCEIFNKSDLDTHLKQQREFYNILKEYICFIGINYKDTKEFKELNIAHTCDALCYYMNYIEEHTSYLKYNEKIMFSSEDRGFNLYKYHTNIFSMVWKKLNNYSEPNYGICEICNEGFYKNSNREKYCSEECEREADRISHAKSYNKKKELQKNLSVLYEKTTKKIDKEKKEEIEKCINSNATDIKKYKMEEIKELIKYLKE